MKLKFAILSQIILTILFGMILNLMAIGQTVNKLKDLPFVNSDLPLKFRIDDLVSRLTVEEKILQMQFTAPAIERLGIPQYNWWNECLHGVARNGIATVFPQAIGMAATFNTRLIQQEADVISTEGRAKYYEAISKNQHEIYQGLTFWSPNINIFRDPRWGRGQETYGEDPFLTSRIGVAFVKGLQGDDPQYFKVISTAKHFAVHSGPESERHRFDAWPSDRDFYDTYLPAFEALVREAKVYSVMSSYNRLFGTPTSCNPLTLEKLLREKWGFKGYVVSDCWAISDIYNFHKFLTEPAKAVSLTVKAGLDLACGNEFVHLKEALDLGYISEAQLDIALKRLFEARFRLGLFDPPSKVKYATIPVTENDTETHRALAREVARQSIVLLKNENSALPLNKKTKDILVVGPYANDTSVLLGNYNGIPSRPVTVLQGLKNRAGKNCRVQYCLGIEKPEIQAIAAEKGLVSKKEILSAEAIAMAQKADAVVFVGGISPQLEGEEMDVKVSGFSGGDRTNLEMPSGQEELLAKLKDLGKPVILVLTNGSAIAPNWAAENLPAIVEAWYPGEEGGNALADVLFGDYNPAGRLPVTFYKSVNDIPAFADYNMKGRTYRYFEGKPLFAFGHGLSYTSFEYVKVDITSSQLTEKDTVALKITVRNTGKFDGDEVIQVYAKQPEAIEGQPIKSLVAFDRVFFKAGEEKEVTLRIPVSQLRHYEPKVIDYAVAKGTYELQIGTASDDIRLKTSILIK